MRLLRGLHGNKAGDDFDLTSAYYISFEKLFGVQLDLFRGIK